MKLKEMRDKLSSEARGSFSEIRNTLTEAASPVLSALSSASALSTSTSSTTKSNATSSSVSTSSQSSGPPHGEEEEEDPYGSSSMFISVSECVSLPPGCEVLVLILCASLVCVSVFLSAFVSLIVLVSYRRRQSMRACWEKRQSVHRQKLKQRCHPHPKPSTQTHLNQRSMQHQHAGLACRMLCRPRA